MNSAKIKPVAINAALMLASIVFTLLLGEVFLRYAPLGIPRVISQPLNLDEHAEMVAPNDEVMACFKPGIHRVATTSDYTTFEISTAAPDGGPCGFREQFAPDRPAALVIGDSFAFGFGVEERDRFSNLPGNSPGGRWVNLGIAGYGPQQEMLVLEKHYSRFPAPFVIWQYFPNDLEDAVKFENWVARGKPKNDIGSKKSALTLWFSRYSSVYKLYKWVMRPHSKKVAHWRDKNTDYVFEYGWLSEVNPANPNLEKGFGLYEQEVRRFKEMAGRQHFTPIILMIPFKEHANFEKFNAVAGVQTLPLERVEYYYKRVRDMAASNGIMVIDALPALVKNRDRQVYFRIDGHLNNEGHRLLADEIIKAFKEHRLENK